MALQIRDEVTPREWAIWNREDENLRLQLAHQKEIKAMEVEVGKINSKWTTIFRLPLALIALPVKLLLVFVFIVYAIRGIEPPESLVSFIKS